MNLQTQSNIEYFVSFSLSQDKTHQGTLPEALGIKNTAVYTLKLFLWARGNKYLFPHIKKKAHTHVSCI